MSEEDFANDIRDNARYNAVCKLAEAEGAETLPICAELEAQIAELDKEEKEILNPLPDISSFAGNSRYEAPFYRKVQHFCKYCIFLCAKRLLFPKKSYIILYCKIYYLEVYSYGS